MTRQLATLRASQPTWAASLLVGRCYPHPPSPFIVIAEAETWCSFALYVCVVVGYSSVLDVCSVAGNLCQSLRSCSSSSCSDRGNCSYNANGTRDCLCEAGFAGTRCELVDWCADQPCRNNASCLLNTTTGNYLCDCLPGSLGVNCSVMDACWQADVCDNGGTCLSSLDGRYTCACVPDYTGLNCSVPVTACFSDPCMNSGSCVRVDSGFTCICAEGFTGLTCEAEIPCSSLPCQHGGTCRQIDATYICDCPSGKSHQHGVLVYCNIDDYIPTSVLIAVFQVDLGWFLSLLPFPVVSAAEMSCLSPNQGRKRVALIQTSGPGLILSSSITTPGRMGVTAFMRVQIVH